MLPGDGSAAVKMSSAETGNGDSVYVQYRRGWVHGYRPNEELVGWRTVRTGKPLTWRKATKAIIIKQVVKEKKAIAGSQVFDLCVKVRPNS